MNEKEQLFLELFEAHNDDIFRFVIFRVNTRETALDLTQESFTKLWEYLISNKVIENPKAFLYQIARNKIIDHYRKHKSYSLDEMTESGFDVQSTDINPEIVDDVRQLLEEAQVLPDKYKEVLLLNVEAGLEPNEIAEVLEISANLASVRLHRAKNALKENMSKKFNI